MYGKAFFRASSHLDVASHKTLLQKNVLTLYTCWVACIGEGIKCRVLANNSVENIPVFSLVSCANLLTMIVHLHAYDCDKKFR